MVQLRRIPLATMSPPSAASLLNRCRLGRRMNEFIHSPVAASTDLLFRLENAKETTNIHHELFEARKTIAAGSLARARAPLIVLTSFYYY